MERNLKPILLILLTLLTVILFSCKRTDVNESDVSYDEVQLGNASFQIHFIDVGQADSALVVCDGKSMLIDGGNVEDSSLIYSYLKNHGITHLDYTIATHPHEDHIGGLSGALNFASVSNVFSPCTEYDSETFEIFKEQVEKREAELYVPQEGEEFALGTATVKIIGCNSANDTNNTSIILKISFGETSFLFTGDAEREAEQVVVDSGVDLKSTVLKVGHHGSSTSTSYLFLREVMPEYAVISVGKNNSYGHPHEEAVSRLEDADSKIFRTDLQGTIICTSDGKNVWFTTEKRAEVPLVNNSESESDYVLNTSSKKFHLPSCSSVSDISEKNKSLYTGKRETLISDGYSPCGNCKP